MRSNINRLIIEMGRICTELSNELEEKLSFGTTERFGGKKGYPQKTVAEYARAWHA